MSSISNESRNSSLNSNQNNNYSDWQPSASHSSYCSDSSSEGSLKKDFDPKYLNFKGNKKLKFLTGWHFFFSKFYENFKLGVTEYDYGSEILNKRLQEDVYGDPESAAKMGFKELVKILGNIWRTIPKKELQSYYALGAKHKKRYEKEREQLAIIKSNNENNEIANINEIFDDEDNFDLGSIPIDKNLYELMLKEKKERMSYKKQKKKVYNKNYKKNRKNKFLDELENGNYDISYLQSLKEKSIKFSGIPFNIFTKDFFNNNLTSNMFSKENYQALSELSAQYQKKEISTNNVMKVISKIWKSIPESEKVIYKEKSINEKKKLEQKYDKKIREKLEKEGKKGKLTSTSLKSKMIKKKQSKNRKRKDSESNLSSFIVDENYSESDENTQSFDYEEEKEFYKFNKNNIFNARNRKRLVKRSVNLLECDPSSGLRENSNSDNYNLFLTKTTNSNTTDKPVLLSGEPKGKLRENSRSNVTNPPIKNEFLEDENFFNQKQSNEIDNLKSDNYTDFKFLNCKRHLRKNSSIDNSVKNSEKGKITLNIKYKSEIDPEVEEELIPSKTQEEVNFKRRRLNEEESLSLKTSNDVFLIDDLNNNYLLKEKINLKEKEEILFESTEKLEEDEYAFHFSTDKVKFELVVKKVLNRSLIFTLKPFPYLQVYSKRFFFNALIMNNIFSNCENINDVFVMVMNSIKDNLIQIRYDRVDNSYEIYVKRNRNQIEPNEADFKLEAEFQSRENLNDIMYDYISRLNECAKKIQDLRSKN